MAAVGGHESVAVSWSPPDDNGGSLITGYRVKWKRASRQSYSGSRLSDRLARTLVLNDLWPGTEYNVSVSAVNMAGTGTASEVPATTLGTPPRPPAEPRDVSAAGGNTSITVSWLPPDDNGGLPITGYEVQRKRVEDSTYSPAKRLSAAARTTVVRDLSPGVEYDVFVAAVNDLSRGPGPVVQATPLGPPTSPQNVSALGQVGGVGVSWSPPSNDGGEPVSGYQVRWKKVSESNYGDPQQLGAEARSFNFTGLPDTEYSVAVAASNVNGPGPEAETQARTSPLPGAPRALVPLVGTDSFVVEWGAPPVSPAAPATGYWVRWKPAGAGAYAGERQLGASERSIAVEGLVAGAEYDVAVSATSSLGEGATALLEVPLVDAPAPPGAPQSLRAAFGLDRSVVSWAPPYSDGGSTVTKYKLSWAGQSEGEAEVTGSSYTSTEFDYGGFYMFRVAAVNSQGEGPAALVPAIPANPAPPPTQLALKASDGNLEISWLFKSVHVSDPARVTAFRVQWKSAAQDYSSDRQAEVPAADRLVFTNRSKRQSHTISPLANGTVYTVRVVAVNETGPGTGPEVSGAPAASAANAAHSLAVKAGAGDLNLSWEAPTLGSDASLDGYRVQWRLEEDEYDATRSADASNTEHSVSGLEPGELYLVRVTALVSDGSGGSVEGRGVPLALPGQPTDFVVEAGDGSVSVSWSPPEPADGAPVVAYKLEWHGTVNHELYLTDTSVDIDGVPNDIARRFRVSAVNSLGAGDIAYETLTLMPVPGPVRDLAVRAGEATLELSWKAPERRGTLEAYRVQWKATGETFDETRQADAAGRSYEISGLTSGADYVVRVAAVQQAVVGPWVEIATAAEGFTDRPEAPSGLTALAGNGQLAVSWGPPPSTNGSTIDGYLVEWRVAGGSFGAVQSEATPSSEQSLQITDLVNATAYEVRVRATTSGGQQGAAAVIRGVPATTPGAPTDAVTHATADTVMVSWRPPDSDGGAAINGYQVMWRSADHQFPRGHCDDRVTFVNDPHYVVSFHSLNWEALIEGEEYFVRVRAQNSNGLGPPLDVSTRLRSGSPQ